MVCGGARAWESHVRSEGFPSPRVGVSVSGGATWLTVARQGALLLDMDQQNTPGLDAPAARTIAGLLIGVVLTAGAFLGGFVVFNNQSAANKAPAAAAAVDPELAKLDVWHIDAGRSIGPIVNGISNIPANSKDGRTKVCGIVTAARVDSLNQIPAAPNTAIDNLFRAWVSDLNAIVDDCKAGTSAKSDTLTQTSGADFGAFYKAITTLIPDTTPQQPNTAVAQGNTTGQQMPGQQMPGQTQNGSGR